MFDVNKIRNDFPMFKNNEYMQGKKMVYFDNANTSFKPQQVIDAIGEYYSKYSCNTHRGDYDLSDKSDKKFEEARKIVADFINAKKVEVCFTSGASMGLNVIAYGYQKFLTKDDEILLTEAEHASNVLPWFKVAETIGCKISYIPLDEHGRLTPENLEKSITKHTKVVSVAHVTNVLGYVNDVKELVKVAHKHNVIFVCDGAQSVPHMKIDVKDLDVDFMVFSGHKCIGPTGIGVLYGKYELLDKLDPLMMGGGMNTKFDMCGDVGYLLPPLKFEAGTQNVAGAIGLGAAIKYLESVGMDNISKYETELKEYAVRRLKEEVPQVKIYNPEADGGIITFNYQGVHAQDMATLLASHGICVRSGEHCAKLLHNLLGTDATVRASLYFYNTKDEVDAFVEACKKGSDFLDAFFA